MKDGFDSVDELHGQQGMASQFKKIVIDSNLVYRKQFPKDSRQPAFNGSARFDTGGGSSCGSKRGHRKRAAVKFPIVTNRQGFQEYEK